MRKEKFEELIKDSFLETDFYYDGLNIIISPLGSHRYNLHCNDTEIVKKDLSFAELMETTIFDNKNLLDMCSDIYNITQY